MLAQVLQVTIIPHSGVTRIPHVCGQLCSVPSSFWGPFLLSQRKWQVRLAVDVNANQDHAADLQTERVDWCRRSLGEQSHSITIWSSCSN